MKLIFAIAILALTVLFPVQILIAIGALISLLILAIVTKFLVKFFSDDFMGAILVSAFLFLVALLIKSKYFV